MAKISNVTGLDALKRKLRSIRHEHGKGFHTGVKKAASYLLVKSRAIVPVEHGPLKASGFAIVHGAGFKAEGWVGYTAEYAVFVHENLEALHGAAYNRAYRNNKRDKAGRFLKREKAFNARGPNQQAKFLEKPLREERQTLKNIITAETKRK